MDRVGGIGCCIVKSGWGVSPGALKERNGQSAFDLVITTRGHLLSFETKFLSTPRHDFSRRNGIVSPEIRVYGQAGNVIETHEYKGDFKEP